MTKTLSEPFSVIDVVQSPFLVTDVFQSPMALGGCTRVVQGASGMPRKRVGSANDISRGVLLIAPFILARFRLIEMALGFHAIVKKSKHNQQDRKSEGAQFHTTSNYEK